MEQIGELGSVAQAVEPRPQALGDQRADQSLRFRCKAALQRVEGDAFGEIVRRPQRAPTTVTRGQNPTRCRSPRASSA